LIRAFDIVRKQSAARLVILGEGSQRTELENLVEMMELGNTVLLPGFQKNHLPYMNAAAVFTLSSRQEAFGNVLVEAMACNCPVVATNCPGGPAELIDYGKSGHLAPVGDENSMAAAIIDVLAGNGRRPPRAWLEQFDLSVILQQYLELLNTPGR
jgi:glycosyltransferase involved in cell wall biosynthesis